MVALGANLCAGQEQCRFTDSYLKEIFHTQYFPKQMEIVPKDGAIVKVGKEKLKWHALDSKLFNVKLFRFATSFKKPKYGVLFWAVTIIDCPEEMKTSACLLARMELPCGGSMVRRR